MQPKSILCPIDFSHFSAAVYQHALSLAEYYKARVVALHVVELWKYPFADYAAHEADYAKFSQALNEGGEVQLQQFTKQHSAGGLQPELVVHQGNAPRCILSCAEKQGIKLIVMGTHGRRGFDRLVLGSSTDRVIRKAACPVLLVSSACQKGVDTGPDGRHCLSRILYCTDFSNNSQQARSYATSLAAEYGAELILLHVAENVPDRARAETIAAERTQQLDKLIAATERKSLNAVGGNVRKAVRGDCSLRRGNAGKPHHYDGTWRRRRGPSCFRLDHLSSDPVGPLPGARHPHVIPLMRGKLDFHG